MKRIVILGTAHEYQRLGHFLNQQLEIRLEHLRSNFNSQVLLEEWSEKAPPSFAASWAARIGLKYQNIGTPDENQSVLYRCPPIDHPSHDGVLGTNFDAPSMSEYGPFEIQEKREEKMVENIRVAMLNDDNGLLLLGIAHLHSMLARLHSRNFDVVGYHWLDLRRE